MVTAPTIWKIPVRLTNPSFPSLKYAHPYGNLLSAGAVSEIKNWIVLRQRELSYYSSTRATQELLPDFATCSL